MRIEKTPHRKFSSVRYSCFSAGFLLLIAGCQGPRTFDDLETLSEDANGNGFLDLQPPAGVSFDTTTNVKVRLSSTLRAANLVEHAAEVGADPSLVNLANFSVNFAFTLGYANGATVTIRETEPLDPFEFAFEVACPVSADLTVELVATAPFTGAPIARIPVGLTLDVVDFDCGNTVEFSTFVNDSGQVDETVEVF